MGAPTQELTRAESFQLTPPEPRQPTYMEMLDYAVKNNAIEVIERIAKLQQDAEKRNAEIDFNVAMNQCQAEIKKVNFDSATPDNAPKKFKWASFEALDNAVRPIYTRYGFSLSWDTADSSIPESILVVCYVSKGLHTRRYQIPMDYTGKGAKGGDVMAKPNAMGAATSYGKRYLVALIFNIATGEEDTYINNGWLGERLEWLENCQNEGELTRIFNQAFSEAKKERAAQAMLTLVEARDKRKKELSF